LIIEHQTYNIQGCLDRRPAEKIIEQTAAGIVDLARRSEPSQAGSQGFLRPAPASTGRGLVEKRDAVMFAAKLVVGCQK